MAFGGSKLLDGAVPLHDLVAAFPTSCIVGCSTAGEIWGETVSDETLTIASLPFDSTTLLSVSERVSEPGDSARAGFEIGRRLSERMPDLTAVFVLCDGLNVNGSALASGLVSGTEGRVTITGGLAGDGVAFGRSWVLVDGQPRSGYVTAVGLAGPKLMVGNGSVGGWDIFGPERRITRSAGNVLFELDGQPALELYKRYLGDRAAGLPATALLFPLAVRSPGRNDEPSVVRTILGVDETDHSMTFAGDVPEGSVAQLMRANFDRLIDGAHHAASVAQPATTGPTFAIVVSCVGRRLVLGRRTEEELEATLAGLPAGSEMVGFYSYGEIAPSDGGMLALHNQTMTVTTISETA